MKRLLKALLGGVLALCLSFGAIVPTYAADSNVDSLVSNLIIYYRQGATTDVLRTLDAIKTVSQEDYEQWNSIVNYWDWIENDMVENIGVAPDGLPNDNTHAFVVLGFALKEDGTMEDELVGRLQVALASARKYPNSYVLVTGGVEKEGWTEGARMYEWLVDNGLEDSRILVENQSLNTAENASYTFDILYGHPTINTISIITSQYHLKRGTLLYYAESLIKARELSVEPIKIVSNAGWYRADKTSEDISLKALSLGMIGIPGLDMTGYMNLMMLVLPTSELQSLAISGKINYTVGEELDIMATATYDIDNYTRDVTALATITGYDATKLGSQTINATYEENGVTVEAKLVIEVKAAPVVDMILNSEDKAVTVSGKLLEGTEFSSSELSEQEVKEVTEKINKMNSEFLKTATLEKVYDLSLMYNSVQYIFDGSMKVTFKLDDTLKGKTLGIIYIDNDGNITKIDSTSDTDYISFYTTHFSTFAIVSYADTTTTTATTVSAPKTGDNSSIEDMLLLSFIGIIGMLAPRKKYRIDNA